MTFQQKGKRNVVSTLVAISAGTVAFGPLGALLGLGLGCLVFYLGLPSLPKRKDIAKDAVSNWIDSWYDTMTKGYKNAVDASIQDQIRTFRQNVNDCRVHRTTVNKIIEAQNTERRGINTDIEQAKADIEKLHSIERALEQEAC